MKKDEFNTLFREYSRKTLSPTQVEKDFIIELYGHICKILNNSCIQIGSYPRFTSIHPLHDLDVLYIVGEMSSFNENQTKILTELQIELQKYFLKNTKYKLKFILQTHSITISFLDANNQEYFSVDVVPAFINGKNEFNLDTYIVPEILRIGRGKRLAFYKDKEANHISIKWIKSDPRGYIQVASNINNENSDYRKAIKFSKKWKHNTSKLNEDFKLKSFHIEQIFVEIFQQNPNINMVDAIFNFFCYIPKYIAQPKIKDRADATVYIDSYLDKLTESQKEIIIQSRDGFLIALETFSSSSSINNLLSGIPYKRHSSSEQYLFDLMIPIFIDPDLKFSIEGYLKNKEGFREYKYPISYNLPIIEIDNKIKFEIKENQTNADLCKWKVKNNNNSPEPRGEITDHQTKNNPESTKYPGEHYVECFAIKNNICTAKDKVIVKIG